MKKYVVLLIVLCGFYAGCKEPQPELHTIEISQTAFKPDEISVASGDSVRWINKDYFHHNVVESGQMQWKSDTLTKGDHFTVKAKQSVTYQCTLHPDMEGRITVSKP